jgi:hypothetical protein
MSTHRDARWLGPLALLLLCTALGGGAFAIRMTFLPDIAPIAFAETPQSLWAVELAIFLRATEFIAAFAGAVALAAAFAGSPAPVRSSPPVDSVRTRAASRPAGVRRAIL